MVVNFEASTQLFHHLVIEVRPIVNDDLVGDPITTDDFFSYELSQHLSGNISV